MRVLWYGKWHPVDGNYVYLRQVSRRQADLGHRVAIAYHGRDDLNAEERDDRIEYLPLPALHPGSSMAIESLATWSSLEQQIRNFSPHVIHGSLRVGTFDLRLPTLSARVDVPLVLTFHVSFADRFNKEAAVAAATYAFYGRALSSAAAVSAMGPQQRRWLTRFANVDPTRIHEIPHGVNHTRFCPGHSDWRDELGASSLVVGYVGRLAPEKNLESLCRGFLQADLEGARLVLVGQGPSARSLKKKFGKHEQIDLLGPIADRSKLADLMRGLDVFVLPSHIEGLSLSLLEAMASGVVPVATEVGEHHSLVDGCGVLVHTARSALGIKRALIELYTHPDRRKTLATAARARARRQGWDRTTGDLMELYRRIV